MTTERVSYEGPVIREDGATWYVRIARWRERGQAMGSRQWVRAELVPADADVRLPVTLPVEV